MRGSERDGGATEAKDKRGGSDILRDLRGVLQVGRRPYHDGPRAQRSANSAVLQRRGGKPLRGQTENVQGASRDLAEQTQRGQEAAQALTQEAVAAYMDFMNSVFPVTGAAGRRTQE